MKHKLYFALLTTLAFGCSQKQESAGNETVTEQEIKTGCYAFRTEKDSALLHIERADSLVSGKLSYFLFEKDRNVGTFSGKMAGDTLLATYTFQSEGVESTREISFLKSGDEWLEGTDVNALHFKPTACPAE